MCCFLISALQFVTCIFHGCKRVNGFPKHHCQDTVIVFKKQPSTPRNNKFKRESKTNKTHPTQQTNKTNNNKKKPKPTKKCSTWGDAPFPAIFETRCRSPPSQVDAELVQSHRVKCWLTAPGLYHLQTMNEFSWVSLYSCTKAFLGGDPDLVQNLL